MWDLEREKKLKLVWRGVGVCETGRNTEGVGSYHPYLFHLLHSFSSSLMAFPWGKKDFRNHMLHRPTHVFTQDALPQRLALPGITYSPSLLMTEIREEWPALVKTTGGPKIGKEHLSTTLMCKTRCETQNKFKVSCQVWVLSANSQWAQWVNRVGFQLPLPFWNMDCKWPTFVKLLSLKNLLSELLSLLTFF